MKKPDFQVADAWPLGRLPSDIKGKAVQALVANHTLIVGQSRSGKTTVARRLIEEILTWTDTRVVILDPNADFKSLDKLMVPPVRDKSAKDFAARWREVRDSIGIATPGGTAWGIDWRKLSLEEMAAFLRLTPNETFAEYRHLDHHRKYQERTSGLGTLADFIR